MSYIFMYEVCMMYVWKAFINYNDLKTVISWQSIKKKRVTQPLSIGNNN